jgi:hypothetical protein
LSRKSTEASRRSLEREDPELEKLRGYEGNWVLDREQSESDDQLLKMQGVNMWVSGFLGGVRTKDAGSHLEFGDAIGSRGS